MAAATVSVRNPLESWFRAKPSFKQELCEPLLGSNDGFAGVDVDYIPMDFFDDIMWEKTWGVKVYDFFPLPAEAMKFWRGPDPVDPTKMVWETHDAPIFRPQFVLQKNGKLQYLWLRAIDSIVKRPQKGFHASNLWGGYSKTLEVIGLNLAGRACWIIPRKGVLARNQTYEQQVQLLQRLGYKAGPSAIDVVTSVFTRRAVKGERHLGNKTGVEGRTTWSYCADNFLDRKGKTCQVVVGHFDPRIDEWNDGLNVYSRNPELSDEDTGMLALKVYPAPKITALVADLAGLPSAVGEIVADYFI